MLNLIIIVVLTFFGYRQTADYLAAKNLGTAGSEEGYPADGAIVSKAESKPGNTTFGVTGNVAEDKPANAAFGVTGNVAEDKPVNAAFGATGNVAEDEPANAAIYKADETSEMSEDTGDEPSNTRVSENSDFKSGNKHVWQWKHTFLYLAVSLTAGLCQLLYGRDGLGSAIEVDRQQKLLMIMLLVLPMAVVDARLKIIPNRFLLIATGIRVLLYVPEFLFSKILPMLTGFTHKLGSVSLGTLTDYTGILVHTVFSNFAGNEDLTGIAGADEQTISMVKTVCSDLAAAFLLGVVFFIVAYGSKYQIGMGDVKLFALMGFYLGLRDAGLAIFCSFAVSGMAAVFLLLSKRKMVGDSIAFAPCVFIGLFGYALLTTASVWTA
ncbi:MAG TPA: prepilin peptidase [Clostridiaceae bacterium]|nr:prepilin peptidase [Clostridiaceae bacterium]